jgi:hypothetical protein
MNSDKMLLDVAAFLKSPDAVWSPANSKDSWHEFDNFLSFLANCPYPTEENLSSDDPVSAGGYDYFESELLAFPLLRRILEQKGVMKSDFSGAFVAEGKEYGFFYPYPEKGVVLHLTDTDFYLYEVTEEKVTRLLAFNGDGQFSIGVSVNLTI